MPKILRLSAVIHESCGIYRAKDIVIVFDLETGLHPGGSDFESSESDSNLSDNKSLWVTDSPQRIAVERPVNYVSCDQYRRRRRPEERCEPTNEGLD